MTTLTITLRSGRTISATAGFDSATGELVLMTTPPGENAVSTEMDAGQLCKAFYDELDFESAHTLRVGTFIIYCREIETISFSEQRT